MSTVFWPPPPWVGRSRSRPRRRSRKRRPRRPRPSPSSSPSSSRLSRVSRWPRSSARLSRPPRSSVRSVRGPRSSVRSAGPCAGRGRRSGPCAGRGRRDCARSPGCRSPGRRCPGRRRAGRPRRRPPRWSRERHRWSEWPRMHRSRPGRGGRPARRAHGAGASVGGWARRRARRRRGCRPAARERRPRGSARRPGVVSTGGAGSAGGAASAGGADAAGSAPGAGSVSAPLRGEPAGRDETRRRRVGAGASAAASATLPSPFVLVTAGSGSGSCGADPPAWRSLIAATRSPLRIFAVSVMFSSPASWRSSASTIVLRLLRRVGAGVPPEVSGAPASGAVPVVTRSVSLTKVLPDRPGTVPGQRISCSSRRVCRTTVGVERGVGSRPERAGRRSSRFRGRAARAVCGQCRCPGPARVATRIRMDRRCATEGRRIRVRRQQPPIPTRRGRSTIRDANCGHASGDLDGDAGRVDRQREHGEAVQVQCGRQRAVRRQSQDGRSGSGDHGRHARRP